MRKHNLVRKVAAMTAAIAMGLSLLACGGGEKETKAPETQKEESVGETDAESTEEAAGTDGAGTETKAAGSEEGGKKDLKVAIVKQMDHASLDEIADAVAAELDKLAADNGITIEYEIYSGQGDQSTLKQIGDQAVADGVDMIIPVATLAAQVMTVCAEETKTPVIYAAISDPEAAEVTGIDYVTGTSDALNTEFILDMMFRQNPDIKKVGLLYSLSEANSQTPIAEAKAYLDAKQIPYTEATANTNDEVIGQRAGLREGGRGLHAHGQCDYVGRACHCGQPDRSGHPPLHRGRLLCEERGLRDLRRQLHRPWNEDGRSGLSGRDGGHGRDGGFLQDGRRHHYRQYRDGGGTQDRSFRICGYGRAGRGPDHRGIKRERMKHR